MNHISTTSVSASIQDIENPIKFDEHTLYIGQNYYDNIYINNVLSCFDRKTRMYFCKLIIKLKKLYNKTIIISDINIDNIFELIDNLIIINDKDVIYNGEKYEFYASNKNNLFEKPLTIILKEEIYEKKGINIGNTDSINELIKAIYRELR